MTIVSDDDSSADEIMYTCVHCGEKTSGKDLRERGGQIKCKDCGYRILKKMKPPLVKRIKAV